MFPVELMTIAVVRSVAGMVMSIIGQSLTSDRMTLMSSRASTDVASSLVGLMSSSDVELIVLTPITVAVTPQCAITRELNMTITCNITPVLCELRSGRLYLLDGRLEATYRLCNRVKPDIAPPRVC